MKDDVVHPNAPAGKSQKYALREHERRFLLARFPNEERIVRTAVLTDNYVTGTRIRLRRSVETENDSTTTIYKLTQKVPAADNGPGLITTFYLNEGEYEVIAKLPARQLRKTRYSVPPFGIDVFETPLNGLVMAEIEVVSAEQSKALSSPPFAVAEVTSDLRFTGGRLAQTTREDLRRALADFGIEI